MRSNKTTIDKLMLEISKYDNLTISEIRKRIDKLMVSRKTNKLIT
ncbi:unnamed protein product, partial [marine sediment metagenome]